MDHKTFTDAKEIRKLELVLRDFYPYLTDEQRKQAFACNSIEELASFAAREHLELPNEIISYSSGGVISSRRRVRPQASNPGLERILAMLRAGDQQEVGGESHVLSTD